MSGATGAGTSTGSAGTSGPSGSSGSEKDGGGRGSAADSPTAGGAVEGVEQRDAHTTQLKAIKPDTQAPGAGALGEGAGSAKGGRGKGAQRGPGGSGSNGRGAQGSSGAAGAQQGAGVQQGARGGAGTQVGQQQTSSPLPGERRQDQQGSVPYHPPQAYAAEETTPDDAVRRPRTGARTAPRVRKARLRVAKADPWSVMKVSFLLSIALGVCTIVASAVLWMVMDAMGVFSSVGSTISEATGSNESNGFDLQSFLSLPHVLMFSTIIAVIDVVLATALATLAAFIYNLSAGFVGGVELTLAEDE
ncbi:DUF3566 domain-containing protein [Streptomyces acidiscabies]|uniref:DUF3566 domain-containing protein n=1 Tax=Streptomyces acidiscabies TaxID=42234 RepID=A0AAP6EGW2_9ACTN|nr:DUF3566 domain-containing protein [Streptomyces acidiscabies]MBP5938365.1 DUF3566 domain-containing protein [Streptomyces sp. LBUM 1476]MBZ3909459.1 DUF3566 domain-containing protein [Streptomyces acidiscabies]MDX2962373.1 DUF3566 domain-containing protein [Streptomyces acidiscabies]MDX3019825.1 DUF3566 domain-containing protein [Streptomyces acidiscabies]MDX3792392.1 DUF3566 domain-containing protein [Streptomyces acidiscabies]